MSLESNTRNARIEAQEVLGDAGSARVLEPSAPAIQTEPYFADDPVGEDGPVEAGPIVLPAGMATTSTANETVDWDQWLAANPGHDEWLAQRWLGGSRRLPDPPATLAETRTALHRLAAYVVAPIRHGVTDKFGLRWTKGGFGTPFFDDDRQIRVDGMDLVDQRAQSARRTPISSLQAAADFLGGSIDPDTAAEHDSPPVGDTDANLTIDAAAVDFLGNWFGMAFAALELVRADQASVDPSRPQLWPGHFDPAIEVGSDNTRASYGASPGDSGEPYLYVSVWWPDRVGADSSDEFWNAEGFVGRNLKLSDFPVGVDPVVTAANFWRETRDKLHG